MLEKDVNAVIGRKIRTQRSLKGYSQAAVAKMLGVSFQQVQKYENGRNNITPAKLLQLSLIFDCGVADLFPVSGPHNDVLAFTPSRRTLHLVQNFERIQSQKMKRHIGDLVRAIADQSNPDKGGP